MTKKTFSLVLILALVVLLIVLIGWIKTPGREVYSVAEVWSKAQRLLGRKITVEGPARFEISQTDGSCCPPRCDCNAAYGHLDLISESSVHYDTNSSLDDIGVSMDCSGDECSVTCTPFDPRAIERLPITGTLAGYVESGEIHGLNLKDIDLSASSQMVDNEWQAIPAGTFVIQRTPATPRPELCPPTP